MNKIAAVIIKKLDAACDGSRVSRAVEAVLSAAAGCIRNSFLGRMCLFDDDRIAAVMNNSVTVKSALDLGGMLKQGSISIARASRAACLIATAVLFCRARLIDILGTSVFFKFMVYNRHGKMEGAGPTSKSARLARRPRW